MVLDNILLSSYVYWFVDEASLRICSGKLILHIILNYYKIKAVQGSVYPTNFTK